jgi:hypothetical protein
MMRRFRATGMCFVVSLLVPFATHADLRYEETTEMKGGMMETLGKFAGMFGKKGLTKSTTSTYIKGDRLRKDQLTGDEPTTSQIIQLDRDQIVTLDHKKKIYSVMTFAEMRAQMEKAIAAAKSQPAQSEPAPSPDKKPDVKVEPKVNVKDTGETKVINGFNTHRVLLTVELEGEDQKTKDKGAMGADTELWITKDISGFDEQNKFYQKYAKKMASPELVKSLDLSPGMGQDPRMADSAQAMRKKMQSLEGVAILTVMSFNVSGTPSEETKTEANSHPKKSSEERKPENMSDAIGKALGGFGGFGRKKKKEDPPQEPAPTAQSTTTSLDGKVTATLMTSTTEMKSFSKTALDASLFDVPAGYKLKVKE